MSPSFTPKTPPSFVSLSDDKARRLLESLLGQLSPVQRQVFLTHLRGQEDPDRIAARLGLSRDTARASLAFVVARLRMVLSDAPLDKTREDWLRRCRDLLTTAMPQGRTPTIEIDLPVVATASDSTEFERGTEVERAGEPTFLVVESREVPAPVLSAAAPPPIAPPPRAEPPVRAAPIPVAPMRAQVSRPPARVGLDLWPRLPALLALLVVVVGGVLAWHAWGPSAPRKDVAVVTEPQRMPPISAEAAPLTAPDFRLVLLRQQHPGLLEDLDFNIWLAEQEVLQ